MQDSVYFDFQVNGYIGVDFNDPSLTVDDVNRAALAMQQDGVRFAFPTVITASEDVMGRCIDVIVKAIAQFETTAQVFRGIHVEGPFISAEPGFVGAHPKRFAGQADLGLMARLLDRGQGIIRLVTLAPEVDRGGVLTRRCVSEGVAVAAGHTDASLRELDICLDQGLSMFTHLGNGCPRLLDRHDNIILRALARRNALRISLIADGHHIPAMLFRHLLEIIPPENVAVVSDAICAAGLGPGTYQLGERSVYVGEDLAARDESREHFVGSASRMVEAEVWLSDCLGVAEPTRRDLLSANGLRWFGKI